MDTWEEMYEEKHEHIQSHEVSDFIYTNHVVAAVKQKMVRSSQDVWRARGVFICAERAALFQYVSIFRTN